MKGTNSTICYLDERMLYIDIAKGVGILLVLLSHSGGFLYGGNFLTAYYMQMFFILAGMTYKYHTDLKGTLIKKCKKLLAPYFGYNFFLICMKILLNHDDVKIFLMYIGGAMYSRYCLYADGREENVYFMLAFNSPLWFLTCMTVTYLMFYVFMRYADNGKKKLIGICFFLAIAMAFDKSSVLLPWSIDTAFVAVVLMFIGYLLRQRNIFGGSKQKQISLFCACLIMYKIFLAVNPTVQMSLRKYGMYGWISVLIFIFLGVAGSMMIIFVCKFLERFWFGRFLAYVGKNTIPVLSLHLLCFFLIDSVCAALGIRSDEKYLFYLLIWIKCGCALFACLAASAFMTKRKSIFKFLKTRD